MAQITIYLPDDLARDLRQRAKRSGKSLSSVVAELARLQFRPGAWPDAVKEAFGSWEGAFPEPEDACPDEVTFEVSEAPARRQRPRK